MSYLKVCEWCGQPFETDLSGKRYCSKACFDKKNEAERHELREQRSKMRFAKKMMSKIETGVLDKRLEQARKEGKTYAEIQKEITIDKIRKGEL